jgi:MFS family permease
MNFLLLPVCADPFTPVALPCPLQWPICGFWSCRTVLPWAAPTRRSWSGAIGVVLASGTAIRLLAGPFGGRLADRTGRPVVILSSFAAAASIVALGYAPARGLPLLLLISLAHATVLAPLTPIADALTLGSASDKPGFEYGWVRAAGSAAFIVGTLVSGRLVEADGLGIIVWLNAGLLAVAACFAWLVPNRVTGARLPEHSSAAAARSGRCSAFRCSVGS